MPDSPALTIPGESPVSDSSGDLTADEVAESLLSRIAPQADPAVWIDLLPRAEVEDHVRALKRRHAAGEKLPLRGASFAVKDNIDCAGRPTTAACPAFAYIPTRSAPVVSRLLDAGAILLGKTNLDQFACGLAGDRSPYGACRNPFDPEYISGGSSSGSAVAVATGQVRFSLGTDTAGSGRVPAGCCNIVGLKPTTGLLSTAGMVPACSSLDCPSVFALTVEDARAVFEVLLGASLPSQDIRAPRFVVPGDDLDDVSGETAALFRQTIARLEGLGWRRATIDFAPLKEVGNLLYEGPWLAERLAPLTEFLAERGDDMHPVTRDLIAAGARFSGTDVFRGLERLRELRHVCQQIFAGADLLVVPTAPALPRLDEVRASSMLWSRRLGTYTNFVNLLGWCALAVPADFTARGLPFGVTFIGPGGAEGLLCQLGTAWQQARGLTLGATGQHCPLPSRPALQPQAAKGYVRVAVAGAHLRGQPFHAALLNTGARFVRACRTAACYRFVALMGLQPPRPGLMRVDQLGGAIHVELYDLPVAGFGALVASVAPPLAIGTIELADGETVKGFLCESLAAARGRDITEFGGWVPFLEALAGRIHNPPENTP